MPGKYPYELIREHIDKTKAFKDKDIIIEEFRKIINSHSLENDSNTPDFILAEYLWDCLVTSTILIGSRNMWYNPTNSGQFPGEHLASEQISIDGRPEEKTGE